MIKNNKNSKSISSEYVFMHQKPKQFRTKYTRKKHKDFWIYITIVTIIIIISVCTYFFKINSPKQIQINENDNKSNDIIIADDIVDKVINNSDSSVIKLSRAELINEGRTACKFFCSETEGAMTFSLYFESSTNTVHCYCYGEGNVEVNDIIFGPTKADMDISKYRQDSNASKINVSKEMKIAGFKTDAKRQSYMSGSRKIIFTTYGGYMDYLRSMHNNDKYLESYEAYVEKYLNIPYQDDMMIELMKSIENESDDIQNQARIAIRMVQTIPYNSDYRYDDINLKDTREERNAYYLKFPYEVLYYKEGDCDEKALLMILLLKKLNYGTALLVFKPEAHAVVGIKCPVEISFKGTGYCYIETVAVSRTGYSDTILEGEYGPISIYSTPKVIKTSDGAQIEDIGSLLW